MILQPQITLDEAVLNANIHLKGTVNEYFACNWEFYIQSDGSVEMGYGCRGIYINLTTGVHKLLLNYFIDEIEKLGGFDKTTTFGYGKSYYTSKRIKLDVSSETKLHLMHIKPCPKCGQPFFQV